MKAPRLSVVVANLRTELDVLTAVVGLSADQMNQRIAVLTQCIDRLEPRSVGLGGGNINAPQPRTRTRKPKPDAATEQTA